MTKRLYAATEELCEILGGFVETLELTTADSECSPERILRSQLAVRADGTASGRADLTVYGRAFDPTDRAAILVAMSETQKLLTLLKNSSCILDIVLLMDELVDQRADVSSTSETAKTIAAVEAALAGMDCAEVRIWLLDGRADDGQVYALADVRGLLEANTPQDMASALPAGVFNFHSFGGRAVVFPRTRILDHVGASYALEVLSTSEILDESKVPYSVASLKCADFVRSTVTPALDRLDKDKQGAALLSDPQMPGVDASKPVSTLLADLDEAAAGRVRELESVRARIDQNYAEAVAKVAQVATEIVDGFMDEADARTVMATAFLDLLETGESDHVVDVQLSGASQSTLRDAFNPALRFFDSVTQFESGKREELAGSDRQLWMSREWLAKLEQELEAAKLRAADADPKAAVEVDVLTGQISEVGAKIEALEQSVVELRTDVMSQDLRISGPGSRSLEGAIQAAAQAAIAEAAKVCVTAEAAVEQAADALRKAQDALKDTLFKAATRGGIVLAGLVAVGLIGLLALPAIFGAVPLIGKPLFGFIGTVVAAEWIKWWVVLTVITLLGYAISAFSTYSNAARGIGALESAHQAVVSNLLRALRKYWDARMAEVQGQIDLRKNSHALKIEEATLSHFGVLRETVARFEKAFVDTLAQLREEVDSFTLASTVSEFIVVESDYAHSLVTQNLSRIRDLASAFFGRHAMSRYFEKFAESGTLEQLRADLALDAHKEFDHLVGEKSVLEVIGRDEGRQRAVHEIARSVPVLYLLEDGGSWSETMLILGSDRKAIEAEFDHTAPRPCVSQIDDPERLVIARVVHGITLVGA